MVRQGFESTRAGNLKGRPSLIPMKSGKDDSAGEKRIGPTGMALPPLPTEAELNPRQRSRQARA